MLWITTNENYQEWTCDKHRERLSQEPDEYLNWAKYAQVLFHQHKDCENISLLKEAIARFPQAPAFHLMMANTYHRMGERELAFEALGRTPTIPDENQKMQAFHLELQLLFTKEDKYLAMKLLSKDPTNQLAIGKLSQIFRENQLDQMLLPICETALQQKPDHTLARYQLAVTYARLGLNDKAKQTLNLEEFVIINELPYPSNYSSDSAFEKAIAAEILNNETLKSDPIYKATVKGLQTAVLRPSHHCPALHGLFEHLQRNIDRIVAEMSHTTLPAVLGRLPQQVRLDAWAVVCQKDGFQESHMHPNAWLSGVYYVSVPKKMPQDAYCGNLVLGVLPSDVLSTEPPWKLRFIQPNRGMLVLFPSYIPHATIPTNSNELRICIAFDIIPIKY